ncbi:MAG: 3-phosphoshikimate 1-carboxyvinyltransferase [Xanthomonadales bacterium]|nr:3-phosphoshikimate 1-carboxyvinyltransferase [Xanthomonadales bacterium]
MSRRLHWIAGPGRPLRGRIAVPGDKSVSHRSVMLAAIAEGSTRIKGFLEGEDTRATAAILERLGVRIDAPDAGTRIVHGVGLHGLRAAQGPLDCGNAGTGMRLLAGLLAGQSFDSELVGDASLSGRPMQRVTAPLARMGARIATAPDGTAPLRISGGQPLVGLEHELAVASAQVKSALLLAGLYAVGPTRVREPHPTRDYTERLLAAFGAEVALVGDTVELRPGRPLVSPGLIQVPGDFSSAAFLIVAATVVPGSDLELTGIGLDARRTGLLDCLREMGAGIEVGSVRIGQAGPVGDLRVRHSPLRGIEVPQARVPDMIDEFPALFVAAALADGETRVSGAGELRVKESDRIAVMADALVRLGAAVETSPDGVRIRGGGLTGGRVDSAGDHRCAMALAVAAQRADGLVRIEDCANVATSFPGFAALAQSTGFSLAEETE